MSASTSLSAQCSFLLLLAAAAGGCSSKSAADATGTLGGADGGGTPKTCSADWEAECARQQCDAKDPAWTDCKINGWSGYVAAPYCKVDTGQDGDDQRLCPPADGEGMQLHFGPENYDDPDDVAKYMLAPGGETYDCAFDETEDVAGKYFGQYIERSRPGAHHVQMSYAVAGDTTPAKTSRVCNIVKDLLGTAATFMAIAQSPSLDVPDLGAKRPDDAPDVGGLDLEGSAAPIDQKRMLQMLAHYLNTSNKPILKEAWFNLYYREPTEVKATLYTLSLLGSGISVPPHKTQTFRRSAVSDVDRNVKYLQGHSHVGNERFSIWHAPTAGSLTKIYESYDPLEPKNLALSPFVKNPEPDATARSPGGMSGAFVLKAGDSLVWECEFQNDSDRLVGDGDPNPVAFGQMCYTYGAFAVPVGEPGANWITGAAMPTDL